MVTNFIANKWFMKTSKCTNPVLLIYRVLRYTAMKSKPAERSAFSYDDRPEPSRIDFAKKTHCGIFDDEQVEDVKTFLRILVVIFSLLGFLCVYSLVCIFCMILYCTVGVPIYIMYHYFHYSSEESTYITHSIWSIQHFL